MPKSITVSRPATDSTAAFGNSVVLSEGDESVQLQKGAIRGSSLYSRAVMKQPKRQPTIRMSNRADCLCPRQSFVMVKKTQHKSVAHRTSRFVALGSSSRPIQEISGVLVLESSGRESRFRMVLRTKILASSFKSNIYKWASNGPESTNHHTD